MSTRLTAGQSITLTGRHAGQVTNSRTAKLTASQRPLLNLRQNDLRALANSLSR